MLESFAYDTPRAEFCCRLGFHHMLDAKYKQAAFWYELATQLEKPSENWGTINHACWTWLPHLQLCVCYDRLGKHQEAYTHNEAAAKYIPDDPKIAYNRQYFQGLLFDKK
jgi:tetratricopeptide (TPR) repeat protein